MDETVPALDGQLLDSQIPPHSDYRQPYIEIGKRLREARITQGLSTQDLADCTWISRAVIRALEVGDKTQLPEEVYLRPLVQRLGNELGWEDICQELPQAAAANVLPSWYNPKLEASFNLGLMEETPIQAYMSYILMLTGLVSSLGWMTYSEWQLQAQDNTPDSAIAESRACRFNCQPEQKSTGAAPAVRSGIEWSH